MWKRFPQAVLSCLLMAATLHASAQDLPSPDGLAYIDTYRAAAVREMMRTGVPVSIKLAQGILETGAGKSPLALRSNNHFGLKCKSTWTGDRVFHDDDHKGECFRKYPSVEESYRDHSDYLRSQPWYAFLFSIPPTDYKAWAQGLKKAGYATSPRYAEMLVKCIETYRLDQITLDVMAGRSGASPAVGELDVEPNRLPAAPTTMEERQPIPGMSIEAEKPQAHPQLLRGRRTVFVRKGTSLLSVATDHGLPLSKLLEWNGIAAGNDILAQDRHIYLRRPVRIPSK